MDIWLLLSSSLSLFSSSLSLSSTLHSRHWRPLLCCGCHGSQRVRCYWGRSIPSTLQTRLHYRPCLSATGNSINVCSTTARVWLKHTSFKRKRLQLTLTFYGTIGMRDRGENPGLIFYCIGYLLVCWFSVIISSLSLYQSLYVWEHVANVSVKEQSWPEVKFHSST